jgi:hypothetical protein
VYFSFNLHAKIIGLIVLSEAYLDGILKKGNSDKYRPWCLFELQYLLHRHLLMSKREGVGSMVCVSICNEISATTLYGNHTHLPTITAEELDIHLDVDKKWFEDWMNEVPFEMRDFMTYPYEVTHLTRASVFSMEFFDDISKLYEEVVKCIEEGVCVCGDRYFNIFFSFLI